LIPCLQTNYPGGKLLINLSAFILRRLKRASSRGGLNEREAPKRLAQLSSFVSHTPFQLCKNTGQKHQN